MGHKFNHLFCDGGIIGANPSKIGGTWAWVIVDGDKGIAVYEGSGVVTPKQAGLETISNNYTELLAAVEGMAALPDGWDGVIHTDSFVTLCRLIGKKPKFNGIPKDLEERTMLARQRLGGFQVVLLDGHPTRKQLASGVGKRGNPCSKWNVMCDEMCRQLSFEFRGTMGLLTEK